MTAPRTTNWDALIASAPMNKDAAVARDGRGISFEPPAKALTNALDAPPPLKPYTDVPENNLTNQRFQKLTVLGLRDLPGRGSGASWVCRCDCGRYACFTSKALKKHRAEGRAMCSECDYIEAIKAGSHRPTKEDILEQQAAKAAQKERMQSACAIIHPKLAELSAAMGAIGITSAEFNAAAADFLRRMRDGGAA